MSSPPGALIKRGANTRTQKPTVKDIVWAAGFYEGEGSAVYQGSTTQIGISQKDIEPLVRMKALFGGHICQPKGRPWFHWAISGARARGFLMTIYQFLSARRKAQAYTALHLSA